MRLFAIALSAAAAVVVMAGAALAQGKSPAFGDWVVAQRVNKMTDAKECFLTNRKHGRLIYTTEDKLLIDFSGRGGVKGFRYRVDQAKAADWHSNDERDGSNFLTIYSWKMELANGKRLLVSGLTVLDKPIDEEISLVGLKQAREQMLQACGVEDPWANGVEDKPWPAPPESMSGTKQSAEPR